MSRYARDSGYNIQRQFAGHEGWFHYCPNEVKKGTVPGPLIADHTFWKASDNQLEAQGLVGFFTDLHSQKILFALHVNGEIIETDLTGTPRPDGSRIDFLAGNDLTGISLFDDLLQVITRRNHQDAITHVEFRRYLSLEGIPLTFIADNGRYLWSENREYALAQEIPKRLLGSINNYLFLDPVHPKGDHRGLLLVPLRAISFPDEGYLSAGGTLEIKNQTPFTPSHSSPSPELNGTQRFLPFRVDNNGEIVPFSDEGRLFLAYLYISQRKEEAAIELLHSLQSHDPLSPAALHILQLIEKHKIFLDHPDPRMVKLHALKLEIDNKEKQALEPIVEYFQGGDGQARLIAYLDMIDNVLQGLNHVSKGCFFSPDAEIHLLEILLRESERLDEKQKETLRSVFLKIAGRLELLKNPGQKPPLKRLNDGKRLAKPLEFLNGYGFQTVNSPPSLRGQ